MKHTLCSYLFGERFQRTVKQPKLFSSEDRWKYEQDTSLVQVRWQTNIQKKQQDKITEIYWISDSMINLTWKSLNDGHWSYRSTLMIMFGNSDEMVPKLTKHTEANGNTCNARKLYMEKEYCIITSVYTILTFGRRREHAYMLASNCLHLIERPTIWIIKDLS